MNKYIKPLYCLILATMFVLHGCQKDVIKPSSGKAIRVNVSAVNTRSLSVTTSNLKSTGRFVLDAFVANDYDVEDEEGNVTTVSAGQYITSNGQYNVLYSSTSHETGREGAEPTDGWYIYDDKGYEAYDWLVGNPTRFWCRYPADAEVSTPAKGRRNITLEDGESMKFEYTMPVASSSKPYNDASNQKDLLFAYAERTYTGGSNEIDINFNHALSKVCFCVSPNDGTFDPTLTVVDISISGMPGYGFCVVNGKGQISKDPECSNPMFTWSRQAGSVTYRQTYNTSFSGNGVPDGWSDIDKAQPFKKYTCENSFMMIPHSLDNAKLGITFGNTGTDSDITVQVNLPKDTWYPGFYYCYKISATTIGRTINVGISLVEWDNYDDKLFF